MQPLTVFLGPSLPALLLEDGSASEEFVLENEIVVARLAEHLSTSFRRLGITQARVVARGAHTRGAFRVSYQAQQTLAPHADSARADVA